MLKELAKMNCVFQDPHPKKSVLMKEGQLGTSHKIQFSRCTWHNMKNTGKKGSIVRFFVQQCEPHERSPCAPKFAERSQEDTLQQERCARKVAWNLVYFFYTSSRIWKNYVLFSC